MSVALTILGCGSSGGVPRVAQGWGDCDPNNPRNRRRRCSVLLERSGGAGSSGKTSVLVDTSPDLREQLLSAAVERLDGVLMTHSHADHTHGMDDLRPLVIAMRKRIDIHMDEATSRAVLQAFDYLFESPAGSLYPPLANEKRLVNGQAVRIEGQGGPIEALPFLLEHGEIPALGLRFGALAYTPDLNGIPAASLPFLEGLDTWIIDGLRYKPHPTHLSVDEALAWIEKMQPRRAIITNLHTDLDYEELKRRLPEKVTPAYDGMRIDVPDI
ncbi:MBL fold metallo-hydrolase [Methylocapsa sp. S129]|uniref:MBL fold metallo-hydrolase n=1 Tax=Methylocapsa sp. S129 TaxID=1641869 RepID=UPI00131DBA47|nr:MBL fold metallo-hydrolase [Methylocapsa sp. S129]